MYEGEEVSDISYVLKKRYTRDPDPDIPGSGIFHHQIILPIQILRIGLWFDK